MEPQTQEIIATLQQAVVELKKGIHAYGSHLEHQNQYQQQISQDFIKKMHHIAVKINIGIEGLVELEALKEQMQQSYQEQQRLQKQENKWE
ncbi:MAG: hypothetical protein QW594_01910 [Candidatus Woesearchaeota archaeon]